ncbi:di/tricarboxylate transporter/Trk K+ transport system NAD-binding subunit [Saonia flava]|uniref:Di/tricarboxylate transporter/Trk K+ transport system NAD-binding subunit n=1 Tax=Saonia flava TaxID=523696 RepID=A0A846QXK0_9FLAO|nr:SLC13 family permease [Saonia flava]NJB71332.1 di/tricarboxylate transporter/Trk K+ transport system NAD-binding subunit [Saonia flava]
MYITIVVLVITIALFVWGKYPPDVVAIMSMLSLFLFGILELKETLAGFSSPTVIMIAALFVIGEGLSRTGWTALAGRKFVSWASNSVPKLLVIVTLGSGILSGFVSNTGTVATLLPVTVSAAWNAATLPSKLLMPVAFGSNTGGLLTLTGTPPNIIVSNVLVEKGLGSFSFFEFSLIGVPLLIITILYFRYIGHRLLPNNRTNNKPVNIDSEMHKWIKDYSIGKDLYRFRIRSMSPLIGTTLSDWEFEKEYKVSLVRLRRRHPNLLKGTPSFVEFPKLNTDLRYHDIITVKGKAKYINRLMLKFKLGVIPTPYTKDELKNEFINHEAGLAQMLITPESTLIGRTIPLGYYLEKTGIQLLGGYRNNTILDTTDVKVKAGDAYIIRGSWENIESLQNVYENVVISGSPEAMSKNVDKLSIKSYIALGTLVLMILLLVLKIIPGAIAALICAGVMMLTGCVPISKAYNDISWTSVVMIAAMIPMGMALQKTGLAAMAANKLVNVLGAIHPIALLGGVFLLTTVFSQTINNSATAVLMAPIALMAAVSLGVSPKPYMICVAISASTAFLTPVGTTTNAMVMAAGNYKFMDYFKVGAPLLLFLFITTMLLVPIIWPF